MSFFGGLNGDGFYDEEYEGGGFSSGEYSYGPPPPIPLEELHLSKTGITTKLAVQFNWYDAGTIWLPKKALSKPHLNHVESWALKLVRQNVKRLCETLKEKKEL